MSLREEYPWLGDTAYLWEPAATMATSAAAEIPSGFYGLLEYARTGDADMAAQAVRDLQERYTYMPRSVQGQRGMEALGGALNTVMEHKGLIPTFSIADTIAFAQDQAGRLGAGPAAFIEGALSAGLPPPARRADLAMDTASRMRRAADMGFDDRTWYHGSTHDIESFGGERLNPESHFGSGHYLTSDPYDASVNYAGEGPDLTSRIEQRMDQLETLVPDDPAAFGIPEGADLTDATLYDIARRELAGETEGVIYPVRTRQDNIFDVSSEGDTWVESQLPEFDPDDYMDEARREFDRADFDDVDDYNDAVRSTAEELADEDRFNFEPEGPLVDFMDSLRRQAGDEADPIIDQLAEYAYDGISAQELDDIMRKTEWYPMDDLGRYNNNEVYRQALQDAGFTGIHMDADTTFKHMDIPYNTTHLIMFDPTDIRSVNAAFDPARRMDPGILAGGAATAVGLGALADEDEEDRRYIYR